MFKEIYKCIAVLAIINVAGEHEAQAWKYKASNDTDDTVKLHVGFATVGCKARVVTLQPYQKDVDVSPHHLKCTGACVSIVIASGPKGKQKFRGFPDCGDRTIHIHPGGHEFSCPYEGSQIAPYTFSGLHGFEYFCK